MNPEQNPLEGLGEVRDEKDALDQSIALNRIVMTMLQHQKESNKRMFIALIISLLINVCVVAGFLYYEVEGSDINNVQGDQYMDNATHNEGGTD